jgi:NAD+ kinase
MGDQPQVNRAIIVGNKAKRAVHEALDGIRSWLAERVEVTVDLAMAEAVDEGDFDLAVVLGGDGSVLAAARGLAPLGIPLLGLNLGKFGFLTETNADDYEDVLTDVLEGRFTVAERMMLDCVLERDGQEEMHCVGMNDVVISRISLSRIATLDFHVGDELVTTYRADGLIIATPIGSTAHSLAAGGPIVHPEMEGLVVTPICPHTLSNRPLVLPAEATVSVVARDGAEGTGLTVDGQVSHDMADGDMVQVKKAPRPLKLFQTGRNVFFSTLRNKLDWRGQPRYVR